MNADIHGLSGAYAVDALDPEERMAFEQHLAQCPECQAEVASLRATATNLSALSATQPPPALRASVLAAITTVRPLPPLEPPVAPPAVDATSVVVPLRSRRPRVPWLLAAAAAVVLGIGGLAWSPWHTGAGRTQLTATEQVLRADDAQRLQKTIGSARATIVRSVSLGKAVIIADNMPAAPLGKDYQLWLEFPGKGMVSAGLMPHDARPTLTMPLEGDASKAIAAGITVEPTGGSPAPTSAPIALFSFS
ncbi:anti-sigma factor domain-containing protein [Nostocoides sp. HKS02]|uniref:anti-sigma factor n=1 Tax=Nostocoides sp. HKS02 TaxID=1813880 RepID=UPI0012B4FD8C|nr:anti-sigma factor [Tetrasphaera sp. HKS02]QGN58769.1 anti-sigma factor [Tetrasphaera sp. HKS02]